MIFGDRMLRVPTAVFAIGLAVVMGCARGSRAEEMPTRPGQAQPGQTPAPVPPPARPDQGVPGTTAQGAVTVRVGAPAYASRDVINATVANGLSRTIYSQDMKTDCSIVILERSDGERWEPIRSCLMERAPIAVAIGPGRVRTVGINPRSFNFSNPSGAGMVPLRPGTYRVTYTYRLASGRQGEEPNAAHSPAFRIGR